MTTIVGAGGIGANTALFLRKARPRAQITIIDRDYVDSHNIARQKTYTARDVGKPKAISTAEKLKIKGLFEELTPKNASKLLAGSEIILDCTDNYSTLAIINNYCLKTGTPWIFSSAIRGEAMLSTVTPETPCWLCWNPKPKKPRSCSEEGTTLRATTTIAKEQVAETLRLLKGLPKYAGKLLYINTKTNFAITKPLHNNPKCKACVLHLKPANQPITVCSENEYLFVLKRKPNLSKYKARRLGPATRIRIGNATITIIGDKMFIKGTDKKKAQLAYEKVKAGSESLSPRREGHPPLSGRLAPTRRVRG